MLERQTKMQRRTVPTSRSWTSIVCSLSASATALAAILAISIGAAGAREATGDRDRAGARKPVLAIVSLSDQRISIYDAHGKLLDAPVSTGSTGYETPAGIFTIVQKKETHHSNLYEDGQMPFMQRITWTGIALHAGALPGRPASHGCIRLPMAFAEQLFGQTDMGMRVLIVRDDMRPSDIAHPALFKSSPVSRDLAQPALRSASLGASAPELNVEPGSAKHLDILKSMAAAKAAELDATTRSERDARGAATRVSSEAAAAARVLRGVEANLAKAESSLQQLESRAEKATSPKAQQQAEDAKAKTVARLSELRGQLEQARSQEQSRRDAADRANEAARTAAVARDQAAQAADEANRKTSPVSVFVSRKTQRLYVRRANYPVYEAPISIRDPDRSIGTFVFTALAPLGRSGEMRWNVVAMYKNPTNIEARPPEQSRRPKARDASAAPTDVASARAALDRLTFDREALEVISEIVLPGSSLIISDEGPSRETGKDTDFVVVMSGEPQGALKVRQREPAFKDEFGRSPSRGSPFFWNW